MEDEIMEMWYLTLNDTKCRLQRQDGNKERAFILIGDPGTKSNFAKRMSESG